jgi:ribose transport system permease protein
LVGPRDGDVDRNELAGPGAATVPLAPAAAADSARATGAPSGGAGARRVADRIFRVPEMGLLILLLVAFAGFTLVNGGFASGPNIQSLFLTIAYTGIVMVGEAVLMIAGEFDLSVGSVAGMAAIIGGILMTKGGLPVPVAIIGAIAAGAVVGLANGVITVKVGIPAFVTTLSMLFVAKGIGYVLSGGDPVYPLPKDVAVLARTDILGQPSLIWVFLLIVVVVDLTMRHTTWGRVIYATGGNPLTTRLAGIRTDRVKILAFILCAALASLGGVLLVSRLQRADASIGLGWELNVIAACVVGGVALGGGAGTIAGAFLGLVLLQGVVQGLVIIGVSSSLQPVVAGIVLIAAAGFDLYRRRRFS